MSEQIILFSVIVPLYNKRDTIANTINTILKQSYKNFELIIINDGSNDGSDEEVIKFADPRIRLIYKENGGVSSARNMGIRLSAGRYICFLDGDDEWEDDFLSSINSLILKYPHISVFSTRFAFRLDNKIIEAQNIQEEVIKNYFKIALKQPVISSSSVCLKKDIFININTFNEKISHGEDLELWSRIGKVYDIAIVRDVKAYYRRNLHGQATSKMPALERSIVNYITFEEAADKYERNYYAKIVISRFFSYLKRLHFAASIKIFLKYKKHISNKEYILYYKHKSNFGN